ncbi:helix-turn-helix transcriptional regulator [Pseudomonas sp. dw_358]|uniref:helix-turn-helix domain-containing protein n=1 Tax=Pseudomonas sp. dw_358 TaxID=2720083 RepID=UPI001BD41A1F|nr:helix-turn-helix transcriptional regulator [Pseudomonas sp. dw_358]
MDIQVISRDGQPEYAVVPWERYQALLAAAGVAAEPVVAPAPQLAATPAELPPLSDLRRLREAKGLVVESLARTVGISPSYLTMIESGAREPDAAIRRSLAWELGVPGWGDRL